MPAVGHTKKPAGLHLLDLLKLGGCQLSLLLAVFLDVTDHVTHGLKLFSLLVRDVNTELFFERHDEFDGIKRVGSKVFNELGFGGDLLWIDSELLDDDVPDFVSDVFCHIC